MRRSAFTMLELLIVVMIIAVLAGISVPNFLEAQVRAKVARARSDLAAIVAAAEHYRLDNHEYPPNPAWVDKMLNSAIFPGVEDFGTVDELNAWTESARLSVPSAMYSITGGGYGYYGSNPAEQSPFIIDGTQSALTTPIQYLGTAFDDPFGSWRNDQYFCVNWDSVVPGGLQVPPYHRNPIPYAVLSYGPNAGLEMLLPTNIGYIPYDPTNGTTSNGDILDFPR